MLAEAIWILMYRIIIPSRDATRCASEAGNNVRLVSEMFFDRNAAKMSEMLTRTQEALMHTDHVLWCAEDDVLGMTSVTRRCD